MLLTISTTHVPATDLGYLLHKHPAKCQTFSVAFGKANVFYSEATETQCSMALVLDVDPVGLVRGRERSLFQYVNDRPYVASSFLSVAIAKVFRTALAGRCDDRPELVNQPIPLTATLSVLPCRGGVSVLEELFEPLGYDVEGRSVPLDESFPDWGDSNYWSVTLKNTVRLSDLLSHLYVLIPVLDTEKHYWVGDDEVEKLLRHGEGWLAEHPRREMITRRYLKRRRRLTRIALSQLATEEEVEDGVDEVAESWGQKLEKVADEIGIDQPVSLNQKRLAKVTEVLKQAGVKRVIDLGCGEGRLLRSLAKDRSFEKLTGMDVSYHVLEIAKNRLKLEKLPIHQADRIQLLQGSVIYRDDRLKGYDAATVVEVIEHMELDRLEAFAKVVFDLTRPPLVIVTTPNVEYNVRYPGMEPGQLRHRDHRFEWTRQEFQDWASSICDRYQYSVEFDGIGDLDEAVGTSTQMAVFRVGG